jgi:hypothetical protein
LCLVCAHVDWRLVPPTGGYGTRVPRLARFRCSMASPRSPSRRICVSVTRQDLARFGSKLSWLHESTSVRLASAASGRALATAVVARGGGGSGAPCSRRSASNFIIVCFLPSTMDGTVLSSTPPRSDARSLERNGKRRTTAHATCFISPMFSPCVITSEDWHHVISKVPSRPCGSQGVAARACIEMPLEVPSHAPIAPRTWRHWR